MNTIVMDRVKSVWVIRWKPYPRNMVKIMNGACKENNLVGCGAIRDAHDISWVILLNLQGELQGFYGRAFGVFEGFNLTKSLRLRMV